MRRLVATCLFSFTISGVFAQNEPVTNASPSEASKTTSTTDFSLREAVTYALQNNVNVTNSQLDIESAKARVGEIRAVGLPQISAQASLQHSLKIQNVILENGAGPFGDSTRPVGSVLAFPFQLKNNALFAVTLNQLIFDGSYLVGLKAASTYNNLSQKSAVQSKIAVTEAVTKAYYSVLVNQERLELLRYNVERIDTLFRQTQAQFKNGFVESIDVDRIEVQYNNLKIDQQRTERLVELTKHLLKFQMGYPVSNPIEITDKLAIQNVETLGIEQNTTFNHSQRIEYSILETQKELAALDIKNVRAGYLPQLVAGLAYGYNPAASQLNKIFDFKDRWYNYSTFSVQLSIPIFDGFQKRYKGQQARLTLEKTNRSLQFLQNSIDLEIQQSNVNLANSLDALKTQRRNLELAERVAKVTKIKYEQGVGSNIEVINAEGSLREAQTNYYSALYDALISKVDADKATGKLAAE